MKQITRSDVLKRRASLDPYEVKNLSEIIFEKLKEFELGSHVFVYLDFRNEVQTRSIIKHLKDIGVKVYVSKMCMKERSMTLYEFESFDRLVTNNYGIAEPDETHKRLDDISILTSSIIPGVAFDESMYRMGYGGGFYDRFLKAAPENMKRIALAFEIQIVKTTHPAEHDEKMDLILTEKRTLVRR